MDRLRSRLLLLVFALCSGCSAWLAHRPERNDVRDSMLVPGRDMYTIEWVFSGSGVGLPGKPVVLFSLDFGNPENPKSTLFNPVVARSGDKIPIDNWSSYLSSNDGASFGPFLFNGDDLRATLFIVDNDKELVANYVRTSVVPIAKEAAKLVGLAGAPGVEGAAIALQAIGDSVANVAEHVSRDDMIAGGMADLIKDGQTRSYTFHSEDGTATVTIRTVRRSLPPRSTDLESWSERVQAAFLSHTGEVLKQRVADLAAEYRTKHEPKLSRTLCDSTVADLADLLPDSPMKTQFFTLIGKTMIKFTLSCGNPNVAFRGAAVRRSSSNRVIGARIFPRGRRGSTSVFAMERAADLVFEVELEQPAVEPVSVQILHPLSGQRLGTMTIPTGQSEGALEGVFDPAALQARQAHRITVQKTYDVLLHANWDAAEEGDPYKIRVVPGPTNEYEFAVPDLPTGSEVTQARYEVREAPTVASHPNHIPAFEQLEVLPAADKSSVAFRARLRSGHTDRAYGRVRLFVTASVPAETDLGTLKTMQHVQMNVPEGSPPRQLLHLANLPSQVRLKIQIKVRGTPGGRPPGIPDPDRQYTYNVAATCNGDVVFQDARTVGNTPGAFEIDQAFEATPDPEGTITISLQVNTSSWQAGIGPQSANVSGEVIVLDAWQE